MMLLKRTAKLLEIVQEVNFQKLLLIYVKIVNQVGEEHFVWFSCRVNIQVELFINHLAKALTYLMDFLSHTWPPLVSLFRLLVPCFLILFSRSSCMFLILCFSILVSAYTFRAIFQSRSLNLSQLSTSFAVDPTQYPLLTCMTGMATMLTPIVTVLPSCHLYLFQPSLCGRSLYFDCVWHSSVLALFIS